jgi:hypothetical protein
MMRGEAMHIRRWLCLNGCQAVVLAMTALLSGIKASLPAYGFGSLVMSLLDEIHHVTPRCETVRHGRL